MCWIRMGRKIAAAVGLVSDPVTVLTPDQKFKIHSKTIHKFNDLNASGTPFAMPAIEEKICWGKLTGKAIPR